MANDSWHESAAKAYDSYCQHQTEKAKIESQERVQKHAIDKLDKLV